MIYDGLWEEDQGTYDLRWNNSYNINNNFIFYYDSIFLNRQGNEIG